MIRSRDEADRLRLVLASLECQAADEIVVVDDGSTDHTQQILAEAEGRLPLRALRHEAARGRSAASNAGARVARGDVLLFLDGDTLAAPGMVEQHARRHAAAANAVCRGEIRHLRCTRLLLDPEAGTPFFNGRETWSQRPAAERDRMRVTSAQVRDRFDDILLRSERGGYPGADPRRLHDLEMTALETAPDCDVLWAAASGPNLSVRRDLFLDLGGFNEALDINEHRELALRLVRSGGAAMLAVAGARSCHMTHRTGWRDPLVATEWEARFLARHRLPPVALLCVFWASLSPASAIPEALRIASLPGLAAAARGGAGLDYDVARRCLGLPALGERFWRGADA